MSFRVDLPQTFPQHLATEKPLTGLFLTSGSATNAEIAAIAGFDWLLIDAEHSPYTLQTVLGLLHTVAAYPTVPVVRVPVNNTELIKQYLDVGAQNLMVPMVHNATAAAAAVAAMHYPPRGVRGIGASLARSSRFGAVKDYLDIASETVSLTVQIESAEGVENAVEIAEVDGVDAVFVGPADLAASMGHLGQQDHPEVLAAIDATFTAVREAGKFVGVNVFNPEQAQKYLAAGADFVCVGADVQQLTVALRGLRGQFPGA